MDRTTPLIEAHDLTAGYNGRPVVSGVNFVALPGQRIAILGPNGGGKTTLIKTLAGELAPLEGRLTRNATVATMPQTDRSRLDFPVSALEVATMGVLPGLPWWKRPGRAERRQARQMLQRVGIGELAERSFGRLSGGQRQRVLIARGLMQHAHILLLDEPFSGLDRQSAAGLEALIAQLAREGRAVLIATHDLEQARRWDRVLCLNHRQIAFGPPGEVLDLETLEATYGGEIVAIPELGAGLLPPHHHTHD